MKPFSTGSSALIFDFDGTIADTLDVLIDVYNERLVREFRCKPFDKTLKEQFRKIPAIEFLNLYGIRYYKLPFMAIRTRFLFKQYVEQVQLFPGISDFIQQAAKAGIFLGIVTSNSRENVVRFLKKQNLHTYFHCVYGGRNLFGKHKVFQKMLVTHRLRAEQVIYIGDEVRDIEAARRVGFRSASVCWGYQHRELLSQHTPDFLVEQPEELQLLL